ncbi:site-2 protease family protein [Silvanigrella sp.]|jgi:Zn-dependent protease|uniref:site-2 protease family protein n=1 Tax=Silvanigrella sp. TaxID=2024976 RepID=UPI0037C5A5B2|nr:site-2 protease family protein [Silvanigrellaceae bacterium]
MSSNPEFSIAIALLKYLGFLIAITMYQAGIAIMAKRKGDNSFQTTQLATFNPIPHIEIVGTIIFPFISILANFPFVLGWPKQFQIDTRYFKKPKLDVNIIYLSGVSINFLISIICMITLRFFLGGSIMPSPTLDLSTPEKLAQLMLSTIGLTNMVLGALFLLPLPGYAGWNILINNVSYNTARKLQEKAMIISIVGMIVIIFGFLNTFFNIFMKLFLIISGY